MWFFFLVMFIVFGCITKSMASRKGYTSAGYWFLGFFLGVIGIVIVACMTDLNRQPNVNVYVQQAQYQQQPQYAQPQPYAHNSRMPAQDKKKCPFCAEVINAEAIYCRFCQHDLPPVSQPAGITPPVSIPAIESSPKQSYTPVYVDAAPTRTFAHARQPVQWECKKCSSKNDSDAQFCKYCGSYKP